MHFAAQSKLVRRFSEGNGGGRGGEYGDGENYAIYACMRRNFVPGLSVSSSTPFSDPIKSTPRYIVVEAHNSKSACKVD